MGEVMVEKALESPNHDAVPGSNSAYSSLVQRFSLCWGCNSSETETETVI